jgi:hypothetical protein
MKITELELTDIVAIISSVIMILGTLSLFMKRMWRFFATKLFEMVDVTKVQSNCTIKQEFTNLKKDFQSLREMDEKHKEQLAEFNAHFVNMEKAMLRLQITQALDHRPSDKVTIYHLYEDYKNRGGNHYIDNLIRDWEKSSANKT